MLTGGIEGGELSTLSQLGITLQRDGTLEVDDDKLSDLVANNPQALSDFLRRCHSKRNGREANHYRRANARQQRGSQAGH